MNDQDNSWVESDRKRLLEALLKERFGAKATVKQFTESDDTPQD